MKIGRTVGNVFELFGAVKEYSHYKLLSGYIRYYDMLCTYYFDFQGLCKKKKKKLFNIVHINISKLATC